MERHPLPYGVIEAEARRMHGTSLRDVVAAIRDGERCNDCGKTRAVINANAIAGLRGYREEKITPETHCACPGGPAYVPLAPAALEDASEDASDDAPSVALGDDDEDEAREFEPSGDPARSGPTLHESGRWIR